MGLTKRQKAYRKYLATDHWKELRRAAIDRDDGACVRCESDVWIQVHHKCYRGRYEDTRLEDLETLCRKCHRLEHGFGPSDFKVKAFEIERFFLRMERPPAKDWIELVGMIETVDDVLWFSEIMFRYIFNVLAHQREGFKPDWWMDKERRNYWFRLAARVRESITERTI